MSQKDLVKEIGFISRPLVVAGVVYWSVPQDLQPFPNRQVNYRINRKKQNVRQTLAWYMRSVSIIDSCLISKIEAQGHR